MFSGRWRRLNPEVKTFLIMIITGTVAAVLGGAATYFYNRLAHRADKRETITAEEHAAEIDRRERSEKRMTEMELQLAVMSAEAKPVQAFMLQVAINKMTHFHTERMDELLSKVGPPSTLTADEEVELETLRQERMVEVHDVVDREEQILAEMFPLQRELAEIELAKIEDGTIGKTVMQRVIAPVPSDAKPQGKKS